MVPIAATVILAGIAAGVAMNLAMLVTFRLLGFGLNGGGILLNPEWQGAKVIAVWTQLQPLPLVVAQPLPVIIGLMVFGLGHAFIYHWLSPTWPPGMWARARRMTLLVFFLSFLFWEFFTPFNQLGEPLPLILLELVFWLLIAFTESLAIAWVSEHPVFQQ